VTQEYTTTWCPCSLSSSSCNHSQLTLGSSWAGLLAGGHTCETAREFFVCVLSLWAPYSFCAQTDSNSKAKPSQACYYWSIKCRCACRTSRLAKEPALSTASSLWWSDSSTQTVLNSRVSKSRACCLIQSCIRRWHLKGNSRRACGCYVQHNFPPRDNGDPSA
jgi:hypothetical protein